MSKGKLDKLSHARCISAFNHTGPLAGIHLSRLLDDNFPRYISSRTDGRFKGIEICFRGYHLDPHHDVGPGRGRIPTILVIMAGGGPLPCRLGANWQQVNFPLEK